MLCEHNKDDSLAFNCTECLERIEGRLRANSFISKTPKPKGPSLYKIYDLLMGLYNRDNLGLAYKDGQPLAVNKTCTWCSKGKQEKGKWTGCASQHFGSGCADKWEGKR